MRLIENTSTLNDYSPGLEFLFPIYLAVTVSPFCTVACFGGMQTHFNVGPSQTYLGW